MPSTPDNEQRSIDHIWAVKITKYRTYGLSDGLYTETTRRDLFGVDMRSNHPRLVVRKMKQEFKTKVGAIRVTTSSLTCSISVFMSLWSDSSSFSKHRAEILPLLEKYHLLTIRR